MSEKTCLVTGATSGIGYETALGLARMGARVIGVGRSAERCAAAQDAIVTATGNREVSFETADLSSQEAIRGLGSRVRGAVEGLDVLVNNAGTFTGRRRLSADGIELQLAVNFLAPFHLTHVLMPLLERPADARVVTLSSGSHFGAKPHWLDLGLGGPYFGLRAYGYTKLASIYFTFELARRMGEGSRLTTFAVDPGLVNTEMGMKDAGFLVRWIWNNRRKTGSTPEEGARTSLFVASDPAAPLDTGRYWKSCTPVPSSPESQDPVAAKQLWTLAERLCGIPQGTWGRQA